MPPITNYTTKTLEQTNFIDILLPNGLLINLEFNLETTLNEIRSRIWDEACKISSINPSLSLKQSIDYYIFTSINQEAKQVEFYDYTKRLSDLKLFFNFFQLIQSHGNLEEKTFNSNLSKTIGLYVNEIEQLKDEEILDFRFELFKEIKENYQNENLIESVYSPNLEIDPNLLDWNIISSRITSINLNDTKIQIFIHITELDQEEITYELNIPLSFTPTDIISYVIRAKLENSNHTKSQIESIIEEYKDTYMLSVCGCDEVFYGNKFKIGSFKYIKNCLSKNTSPRFNLISVSKLKSKLKMDGETMQINLIENFISSQQQRINNQAILFDSQAYDLSWNINDTFNLYLENLIYVPYIKECEKVYLKIAIFNGQELKYQIESEKFDYNKLIGKDSSIKLNSLINFEFRIKFLHRCDKICISLNCVSKRKREFFSMGWISLNLFDYKGELISGKRKLYLWPSTHSSFLNQCLSDVTGQNLEKDYVRLNVEFLKNRSFLNKKIVYPSKDIIKNLVSKISFNSQDECIDVKYALENDNNLLESILNKDALAELSEQEKNVLWRRREDCLNYPHSLPKLLQSVKWSNRIDVIEMYRLLFKWPLIKPVQALELLNSIHSDLEVRNFACNCLDKFMKDEEVQQYMLQLVQSLKNEPYYDNYLSRFLLKRALKSQRIGFDLFWNLKSEMKNCRYKYRFGLILEAYCRGISNYQLKELLRQVEAVDKLSSLAQDIKSNPDNISLVKTSYLKEILERTDYNETLSNLISPLNRSHLLGSIEPDKCKILTSAKRPLYLTWKNNIEYSAYYKETFELIFKQGDDLRQDMLTLQILKLMDILWKSEGLDLKMLIYDCFSTGSKTGFIEVITNSMTLFKIQMEGGMKGRYQIDTLQLFKWLQANNQSNEKLDQSINLFTRSCAGFCVATFILGIGDRHPDNIMVNKHGQLFHIDFGHFLGHFKKKYGIKRERVPFVLTEDFTRVISKGSLNPIETNEFLHFKSLCEDAYMIIRRYSHLIINLFALMLSSDMPELQSIEDIMYLRKTLAIEETDEKALEYFRNQFNEAYKLSYTTKLDWMCHALNKKNLI